MLSDRCNSIHKLNIMGKNRCCNQHLLKSQSGESTSSDRHVMNECLGENISIQSFKQNLSNKYKQISPK